MLPLFPTAKVWRAGLAASAIGVALALLADASVANAYSDTTSYDLPISDGGGGGRWFTGSVADGYGCDVCHNATADLKVGVSGLPGSYVPGESYEIGVHWPEVVEHVAVLLEVVDAKGMPAGSFDTPRPEALHPDELCHREGLDEIPGTFIVSSETGRQFAAVIDCGARSMRMQWTAPSAASGALSLNGGLVASNGDARVDGDASFMIRRTLPISGVTADVKLAQPAGCGIVGVVVGVGADRAIWFGLLLLVGMRVISRRRRENQV